MLFVCYLHLPCLIFGCGNLRLCSEAPRQYHHCCIHPLDPQISFFCVGFEPTALCSQLKPVCTLFPLLFSSPALLPPPRRVCFLCVFEETARSLAGRSDGTIDLMDAARQTLDLWQCLCLYTLSSLSSCLCR